MIDKKNTKKRGRARTKVVLPSGIASLVHQVQNGGTEPVTGDGDNKGTIQNENSDSSQTPENAEKGQKKASENRVFENDRAVGREFAKNEENGKEQSGRVEEPSSQSLENADQQTVKRGPGRPANEKSSITPTEKAARDYKVLVDNGSDAWDLFMALGRDYKTRDSKLATIYIDEDLKTVLDRLKTASDVKLPTAAILSSIVARFIFDHKEKINEVIFGKPLI